MEGCWMFVDQKNKRSGEGLERWLSTAVYLLLLHRAQIGSPAPTSASSQPPVTSVSRDLPPFTALLGHICGMYACTQHPYTHIK